MFIFWTSKFRNPNNVKASSDISFILTHIFTIWIWIWIRYLNSVGFLFVGFFFSSLVEKIKVIKVKFILAIFETSVVKLCSIYNF